MLCIVCTAKPHTPCVYLQTHCPGVNTPPQEVVPIISHSSAALLTCQSLHVSPYTSVLTHQSLHVSPYTSVLTRQSLHICPYTSVLTRQSLHVSPYTSVRTRQSLHVSPYMSVLTCQSLRCANVLKNSAGSCFCAVVIRLTD